MNEIMLLLDQMMLKSVCDLSFKNANKYQLNQF